MKIFSLLILSTLFACQNSIKQEDETIETMLDSSVIFEQESSFVEVEESDISYSEFVPEILPDFELSNFDIDYAYQIGSNSIVVGYDQTVEPDYDASWGDKLLLLNSDNEVLYASKGAGDAYLFEPHFYKNNSTDRIIIICQRGFEYYFGGEAFLLENNTITYIGDLDIESNNHEISLTDIIEINERQQKIVFTFNSDTLILEPGSKDVLIKNTGVSYIFKNEELVLEIK